MRRHLRDFWLTHDWSGRDISTILLFNETTTWINWKWCQWKLLGYLCDFIQWRIDIKIMRIVLVVAICQFGESFQKWGSKQQSAANIFFFLELQ